MARIAGIDLPKNKRGEIGLTYIKELVVTVLVRFFYKSALTWTRRCRIGMMMTWVRFVISLLLTSKWKVNFARKLRWTSNVWWTSVVTVEFVTVVACHCVVNTPKTTHVLVKGNVRLLQTRRRQPSKIVGCWKAALIYRARQTGLITWIFELWLKTSKRKRRLG